MRLNQILQPPGSKGVAAFSLLTSMLLAAPQCSSQPVPEAAARQRVLLDADWRFQLESEAGLADAVSIVNWRWKTDKQQGGEVANAVREADTTGSDWHESKSGDDNMNGAPSYKWFRAALPAVSGPNRTIHFETVDHDCTIYLNGREIARHSGWNDPFDVSLDQAWDSGGSNVLALLVHNSPSLHGGITAAVTLGSRLPIERTENFFAADFNDRGWRAVHLPHDFVVEGTFTNTAQAAHGYLPMPAAWYRKTFTLPASAATNSVWVEFDGVNRDSVVYLNGRKLGEHKSGYTPARYDISQAASFGGQNVLAVRLDSRRFEGWYYEGGGIYRHVWLNVANRLHVAPNGIFVSADLPEPGLDGNAAPATIHVKTKLANDGTIPARCEVVSHLVDASGQTAGEFTNLVTVPAGDDEELVQQGIVEHPQLWSLEAPTLYRLQTFIVVNGVTVDTSNTRFGIRTIRFDADKGFFLNGKPVKLQGMCVHQDFWGVGIAIPDSLDYWRVKQLKAMGCNAWRMSHNPPSPALLDACDELGMLVMDENRHLGDTYLDHSVSGTKYTNPADLAEMVQRDRNHPSIIMWSMCNEEWLQGSVEGARLLAGMIKTVRQYDTTRPISCAMNGGWFQPGFTTVEDVIGINYSPNQYDRFHGEHPKLAMFGSETASTKMTRGQYTSERQRAFVSSYSVTNDCWRSVGERPFMAGSFAWTGIDYRGEATWPAILNQSGALDLCGFPKDSYYYYQSWWKTNPVIHIMPHWNWPGKEGQEIQVVVLSNCERVELFLNGTSLGSKDMPRNGHLLWTLNYLPGTVTAKGYNAGLLAISDTVETTGAPAALRLKTDRTKLVSDGEDLAPVEVDVLDAEGRIVPTADNPVTFRVDGAGFVAGVGNGNPTDHDPEKASSRHAFNGKCMVLVGTTEKPGDMILTATSPGLKSATMSLGAMPDEISTK